MSQQIFDPLLLAARP